MKKKHLIGGLEGVKEMSSIWGVKLNIDDNPHWAHEIKCDVPWLESPFHDNHYHLMVKFAQPEDSRAIFHIMKDNNINGSFYPIKNEKEHILKLLRYSDFGYSRFDLHEHNGYDISFVFTLSETEELELMKEISFALKKGYLKYYNKPITDYHTLVDYYLNAQAFEALNCVTGRFAPYFVSLCESL